MLPGHTYEPIEVTEARELLRQMWEPLPAWEFTASELRALLELPTVEYFPLIKRRDATVKRDAAQGRFRGGFRAPRR